MKIKTTYWIFTTLLLVPFTLSGLGFTLELGPAIEGMTRLGYPLYLIRFLGIAKLLGVVAVASGRYPKIKEWAYAGLTFNLLGAAYSHYCAHEGNKVIGPVVILGFLVASYFYWNKRSPEAEAQELRSRLA